MLTHPLFVLSFIFGGVNNKLYVISGLGADHTVFVRLKLPNYTILHVTWVVPDKTDTMSSYARKLLLQIKDENPIILGLSFGGMLALEIGKIVPTAKIISLSSIISLKELPWHYRLGGFLRLQKTLPIYTFSRIKCFAQWFFGVYTTQDKQVLNGVMERLDRHFLYWALNAMLTWKNENSIPNLSRIHGTADRVLPYGKAKRYEVSIENGTHLMLLDKSEVVSAALLKVLKINVF